MMDAGEGGGVGSAGSASGCGDECDVAAVPVTTDSSSGESMHRDVSPGERFGGQCEVARPQAFVHVELPMHGLRGRRATRRGDPIRDAREIVAADGADEVIGVEYEREPPVVAVVGLRALEKSCGRLVGIECRYVRQRLHDVADASRTPSGATRQPQLMTAHTAEQ